MAKMNGFIKLAFLISVLWHVECFPNHSVGGHHLSKRQIASSVCSTNTCKYGTCEIVSQIAYKCHCRSGITGTNCDMQAPANNPCASNPCYGESRCVNMGASQFQCLCGAGYGGSLCKGTLNTCSCQNGGTCVPRNTNTGAVAYECNCPANFGGNLCQYVKSVFASCQNVGCRNGGYCTIFSTCICPAGFGGNFCQSPVAITTTTPVAPVTTTAATTAYPFALNVCAPGICLNGGTCYQITYSLALCSCVNGFSGVYCNINPGYVTLPATSAFPMTSSAAPITAGPVTVAPVTVTVAPATFCSINPCQNGGICVPTTGNAGRCICAAAFTGFLCETGYSCRNVVCPIGQTCAIGSNNLPQCIPTRT